MEDQAEGLRALAREARQGKFPFEVAGPAAEAKKASVFQAPAARARVVTVTSGKGGVGKSNLSINLSLALCRLGKQVILFDADLGLANVDVLMGLSPRYNLQHVVYGMKPIHEVMVDGPEGLKVIASGSGISQLANLNSGQRERILSQFSLLEDRADYIVVDTGAGISRNVLAFVLAADESLVVTTPEPTARLDAYGMVKVVSQEKIQARLSLVVNQVRDEREGDENGELIRTLAQRFLNMSLDYLGCVRRDGHVSQAVREQTPFLLSYPNSPAARDVSLLAGRLSATQSLEGRPGDGSRFFSRLAAFFSR